MKHCLWGSMNIDTVLHGSLRESKGLSIPRLKLVQINSLMPQAKQSTFAGYIQSIHYPSCTKRAV